MNVKINNTISVPSLESWEFEKTRQSFFLKMATSRFSNMCFSTATDMIPPFKVSIENFLFVKEHLFELKQLCGFMMDWSCQKNTISLLMPRYANSISFSVYASCFHECVNQKKLRWGCTFVVSLEMALLAYGNR